MKLAQTPNATAVRIAYPWFSNTRSSCAMSLDMFSYLRSLVSAT